MPRVLALVNLPIFGGPHNQLIRLDKPLAQHGWETLAVIPDERGSAYERLAAAGVPLAPVRLHRLRAQRDLRVQASYLAGLAGDVLRLRNLIWREQVDLVQIGGLMNPQAGLAAYLAGVPIVWQILGTTAPMPLRRVLMPLVVRLADVLMVTGRKVAAVHPGALGMGPRMVSFFPPVAEPFFAPTAPRRAAARAALGIPADALVMGTVGNRNKLKGHDRLVQLAAHLHPRYAQLHTVILGGETTHTQYYEQEVVAVAAQCGLRASERFHLVDPGQAVADLLPAFDLFLLTSRQEGVPTVILEAMASGLPVVSTDVGAVSEIVQHGTTGYVVAAGDGAMLAAATATLLDYPALRAQMGEAARQQAHTCYTLAQCVGLHLHAYTLAQQHHAHRNRHRRGSA